MKKRFEYEYPHPAVTTDCVVFGFDGKKLHILLIERGLEPFKGSWALPGGFMKIDETVEECAIRELKEETNVENLYLEQFHVFSDPKRDPRERVITVAFIALVRKSDYYNIVASDDAARVAWFMVDQLPPLAFDHDKIIKMGREHLKKMLRISPIAFKLLDESFSMPELQRLYEIITGRKYDRRNFARKMTSTDLLSAEPAEDMRAQKVKSSPKAPKAPEEPLSFCRMVATTPRDEEISMEIPYMASYSPSVNKSSNEIEPIEEGDVPDLSYNCCIEYEEAPRRRRDKKHSESESPSPRTPVRYTFDEERYKEESEDDSQHRNPFDI